ncbi:hypothetical protein N7532_008268 [Penicillium argentinense]|uniref:Uncharacterized protein n=1 Tax=Penicillium argentinense TaxID=1131581 RepID=A0A9W9EX50_9EURO|nr:uncharacterized protein N7532_008268 [Penicillium argentinense]KAJ5089584.1 hypothetical protein N7532_008268 [Penicillium argentinense]
MGSSTGQCVAALEGHGDWEGLISWLQDGSTLASASSDNTVRIWNPATGHDAVKSTFWSQDSSRLASTSDDHTWDPATGQSVSTLKRHSAWVSSIAWSHDGMHRLPLSPADYRSSVALFLVYVQQLWQSAVHQVTSYV